jgi:HD superfamily phosphodiesterase
MDMKTKITSIYDRFLVPQNVIEHQLMVASVASLIYKNYFHKVPSSDFVIACLVHDIGNIAKITTSPQREWKYQYKESIETILQNQQKLKEKYEYTDEDDLAFRIITDISPSKKVKEILDYSMFTNSAERYSEEKQILMYADLRINNNQLVTITNRISYIFERYKNRKNIKDKITKRQFLSNCRYLNRKFKKTCQLFSDNEIKQKKLALRNFAF